MRKLDAEIHIRKARNLVSSTLDFRPVAIALNQHYVYRNEDIGL